MEKPNWVNTVIWLAKFAAAVAVVLVLVYLVYVGIIKNPDGFVGFIQDITGQ